MKLYAAFPLAALLLASAAFRQPVVSEAKDLQRDAVAQQVESLLRNAGYPDDKAMQATGFASLPYHAFRIPGCAHGALAATLHFREFDLLRAAWARVASTFPDYRLSLHYGDGEWSEINRPAIAGKQIRLNFANFLGLTTHAREIAVLVASHRSCGTPVMDWSEVWRPDTVTTRKATRP
jgi:hypothetical protein